MIIRQRDIVEIAFYTGRKPETHPAIVVSTDEIFELEGFFYAILLSTKNIIPDFTLEINPTMINNPRNQRTGFAVCHMIQQFYLEDVVTRTGASLKAEIFRKVIDKAQQVIFGLDK
ncbi:MAG: type II toxin-antitoxin system PemK/MazF family toxin [Mucilaginibacter sp.]